MFDSLLISTDFRNFTQSRFFPFRALGGSFFETLDVS